MFSCCYCGKVWFHENECNWEKNVLDNSKEYFYSPTEILNQNVLFLYVSLSWNIFFQIDISAANANLMLFSKWNNSFELKQFGMNQYLFQMPKWDSGQNVKICHICKSQSKFQELIFFAVYTHIYRISKTY